MTRYVYSCVKWRTATAQTVLEVPGRARHSPFQLNLHTTLFATIRRLFFYADTACGSYLIHSWHSPVTNRNRYCFSVKKCNSQLYFFSSIHLSGENVQVDIKRDPWSLLTALLIIINYLNKMTDFIKDVGISYNIRDNKTQSITNFNFPQLIKPCMHAFISEF
jgi:hypothetical protein